MSLWVDCVRTGLFSVVVLAKWPTVPAKSFGRPQLSSNPVSTTEIPRQWQNLHLD